MLSAVKFQTVADIFEQLGEASVENLSHLYHMKKTMRQTGKRSQ